MFQQHINQTLVEFTMIYMRMPQFLEEKVMMIHNTKGNRTLFLQILLVFGKVNVHIHAPVAFKITKADASR